MTKNILRQKFGFNFHIIRFLGIGGVFSTAIVLATFLWDRISLPFHNPMQVVGYCARKQFNPGNDLVRFLVYVLLPPLFLILLDFFGGQELRGLLFGRPTIAITPVPAPKGTTSRPWFVTCFLLAYAVLIALNVPTYHAFGKFDAFHEGESLGTAASYLAGQKPYRDFFFYHGLIQDPLRSVWAFQLFGKSIGAERTLESLLKVSAWIFLALSIDRLFRKRAVFAAALLSIFALFYVGFSFLTFGTLFLSQLSPQSIVAEFQRHQSFWERFDFLIIPSRTVAVYAFLFIFLSLIDFFRDGLKRNGLNLAAFAFLFSFIPFAALGYSADQGIYLTIVYVFFFPVQYFLFVAGKPWREKWLFFSILGFFAAFLSLQGLSRGCLVDGLKFIFITLPAYKELADKIPVPIHQWKFQFIFILLAAHLYRFVWLGLREKNSSGGKDWFGSFFRKNLLDLVLLFLAGVSFIGILYRSDEEHLIYSSGILYILTFYIACGFFKKIPDRLGYALKFSTFLLTILIAFFCLARDLRSNILEENFPVGVPDEAFIPPNDMEAIRFLKAHMDSSDDFFTMASEASWYYFLDKVCPTQFPNIGVASPRLFQEEIVRDLADKKVKWVLYKDNDWSYRIDGISNEKRYPFVAQYIRENYRVFRNIGGNEIRVLDPR